VVLTVRDDLHDNRRRPARSIVLVLVAVAAVALAAVAVAALWAGLTDHRDSRHFDRRADAPTSGDLAFVLPDVVPQDARDITVHAGTDDPDAKMYDWTSASGELPGGACEPRETSAVAAPFDVAQWPEQVTQGQGLACDAFFVREVSGRFYAWIG
jgi:hypothetical protein